MVSQIILASSSSIRQTLLANAGIDFKSISPRIDEDMIKASLLYENTPARDIADSIADLKAKKISSKYPQSPTLGCDQVAVFQNALLSKPKSKADLKQHLKAMRGQTHHLFSAAVIYLDGQPQWRFVGKAGLTMRNASDAFINNYVDQNWDDVRHCVGGYMIENTGIRLFENIQGDYFHILGLPLVEILSYLCLRGFVEG